MFKTIASILAGCMAGAWAMGMSVAWAAAPVGALAGAALAQASPAQGTWADARQQVDDLLRRARQAMAEGDLAAAEQLVTQAEALKVSYGPLHMGDTPAKARRDLEQKREASQSPTRPSQRFSPFATGASAPGADPFAGRLPDAARTAGGSAGSVDLRQVVPPGDSAAPSPVRRLPPDDARAPLATSGAAVPPAGSDGDLPPALAGLRPAVPAGSAAQAEGRQLLLEARRALATGDTRRAAGLVQQARNLQARFDPLGDTPDRVESEIRRFEDVTARRGQSEADRRAYARMLMDHATALLAGGDTALAEQLAQEAARQQLSYGPMEQKPEDLLRRIGALKQQGAAPLQGAAAGSRAADVSFQSAGGGPSYDPELARQAKELIRQARAALAAGQVAQADELARRAEAMRLPDSAFAPGEDRPGLVLLDIRTARLQAASGVMPASGYAALAAGTGRADRAASRALYEPANDTTRNVPASAERYPEGIPALGRFAQNGPTPAPPGGPRADLPMTPPRESVAESLFRQGEEALRAHDTDRAYQFFRQAAQYRDELDPLTAQRLQDHLQLLSPPAQNRQAGDPARSIVDETTAAQQILARQVAADLAHQESNAKAMLASDPQGALESLQQARQMVESAGLEPGMRAQLLRRVDRSIADAQRFIEENRPQIELDERNRAIREEVVRDRQAKVEVQEKLALMVDEFNRLMDEQRFPEAEVIAKRAAELDPENPLIQQLLWQSKFVRRFMRDKATAAEKENNLIAALQSVDESAIPFDDQTPFRFGDAKQWAELTRMRQKYLAERNRRRSPRELEIEEKLKTPVTLEFKDAPLSRVLEYLGKYAEVNLHLDSQGLAEEGITTDTPVTIEVRHEIMLKSALNLILEPLHLSYVIKDEVLKITSEQMRDGQVYTVTYNVADLVVPIPNFVPGNRMGLAGAYHDAMGSVGFGGTGPFGVATAPPLAVLASHDGTEATGAINPAVLAQMAGAATPGAPGANMPLGFGPGGLGGGAQADFDSLIELITSTVRPTTWDEVGGPGSIAPFETNLSIVVSQTQEVHEEIADLLEQLRRLQDLQVTIEVRFITLNDNFFERIGVDFDFDIDDNIDMALPNQGFGRLVGYDPVTGAPIRDLNDRDNPADQTQTLKIGLQGPTSETATLFSADLDIPFRQNSFGLTQPQFGGYAVGAGATLGFAILSDIEAFFFIEAAQGDRRSNVLQAPKVTLFNGQQAFVSDTSQTPFVISVIPVVGDFAAAQQPVIVVLSEGTFMTVQAVVSNDRRFVRLTVVPFFSRIGDVQTFTFVGTETTTTDTSAQGWVNPNDPNDRRRTNNNAQATSTRSGTTVQLPTFSFITVTTTVSVPDGGTVLLGGIKRLSEERRESGVPMLNKLPYINRLFKNVGIGRDTQSLMMMVTPRIIIQEEEEQRLGIVPP